MQKEQLNKFMEQLGGMLFSPKRHTETYMEDRTLKMKFIISVGLVQYLGLFLGLVLMFTMLYPEPLWYPESIKSGPSLYILTLSNPILLIGIFIIGYALIVLISYIFIGWLNYFICKRLSKENPKRDEFKLKLFLTHYGFSMAPIGIFCVFDVFWIFFFEKFNYASTLFPFADFTIPVTIFFSVLGFTILWKWIIQIRINQSYFGLPVKKSIVPILIQLTLLIIILIVGGSLANLAVPQFA